MSGKRSEAKLVTWRVKRPGIELYGWSRCCIDDTKVINKRGSVFIPSLIVDWASWTIKFENCVRRTNDSAMIRVRGFVQSSIGVT